jgi:hypothetical protein
MYGKRETYEFTVLISDKVEKLKDLLTAKDTEEMDSYHLVKLIYPMGTLKNLSLDQTFEQQNIPH